MLAKTKRHIRKAKRSRKDLHQRILRYVDIRLDRGESHEEILSLIRIDKVNTTVPGQNNLSPNTLSRAFSSGDFTSIPEPVDNHISNDPTHASLFSAEPFPPILTISNSLQEQEFESTPHLQFFFPIQQCSRCQRPTVNVSRFCSDICEILSLPLN